MNRKKLIFKPQRCIGCRICEQICTMTHFGITNHEKAFIRIIRDANKQAEQAIFCHSCKNTPCIEACSYEALSKNLNTNAIEVNSDNCVGCGNCIEQCPYSVPIMDSEGNFVLICDLCKGNPECVLICPENAIQYLDNENLSNL